MKDVAARLTTRVQITTDGHKAYIEAVEGAFGMDVDYVLLIEQYGSLARPDTRIQPRRLHWNGIMRGHGQPGPRPPQHIVCGAPESNDANVGAPVYPVDQRLLKEGREP